MKSKTLLMAPLLLPALALAQEGGGFPSGHADVYMLPNANLELRAPGGGSADIDGDGYGIKAFAHITDLFMATGEYQSVSYDGGADRSDMRLGGGIGGSTGNGLFAEYVKIEDADGFAVYGRAVYSWGIPRLQTHGQAGYIQLEDDERAYGFEFSLGAAYAIMDVAGGTLAAMVDYRLTNLEGQDSSAEVKFRDLRAGVRFMFGGSSGMPDSGDESVGVAPVAEDGSEDVSVEEPAAEEDGFEPVE